ncbi:unnamed protein product, partial [Cyprideis torosa]
MPQRDSSATRDGAKDSSSMLKFFALKIPKFRNTITASGSESNCAQVPYCFHSEDIECDPFLWSRLHPCEHISSSASCLSAIPPSPSEDYRVLRQLYSETEVDIEIIPQFKPLLYSETEVDIEIIPQFKPLLFVTTLPSPRAPDLGSENLLDRQFWRVSFPLRLTLFCPKSFRPATVPLRCSVFPCLELRHFPQRRK